MEDDGRDLVVTEAVRSVKLLKIEGYSATATMMGEYIKPRSRWNIDDHKWEVHFYPGHCQFLDDDDIIPGFDDYVEWIALKLILVSEPKRDKLRVSMSCRLVCPSKRPSEEKTVSHVFDGRSKCSSEVFLMPKHRVPSSGYLVNDSLTVECTITVLGDVNHTDDDQHLPVPPPSDLHQHFGELLQSQDGADITFHVSGESFSAHKLILAARSSVFKAAFFGGMEERSSDSVQIKDMEAAVFRSMLHFIYTDMAPELDNEEGLEVAATMAQHLLVAADRYGLNRLKLICECKLSGGISIGTAATTLALAEKHNCSLLKAKCVEFVTKSPETLDAVLATDGYAHLMASCPLVLTELLRTACGRKISAG